MPITVHDDKKTQELGEYEVGAANSQCDFPGIAQCFAIVGQSEGKLVCAHVSPGTTRDQMTQIFNGLTAKGGGSVTSWYVVGPCNEHFKGNRTIWKSRKDIRETFNEAYSKDTQVFLLDASNERAEKFYDEVSGLNVTNRAIGIRATKMGIGVNFMYRAEQGRNRYGPWKQLRIAKFTKL